MNKHLLHPKNWLIGLAALIIRLITLLPYYIQMKLGATFGAISYCFAKERRNIARINIELCFPKLSTQKQKKLVKDNFISSGKALFETAIAYSSSDKKIAGLYKISGLKNLRDALKEGNGVILLTAHFTMLDLALRMLNISADEPVQMMYRQHTNPAIEHIIHTGRIRHCKKTFGKKDLKGFFASLKDNNAIWYAPDQNFRYHMVFAPFFGIQAATVTGTSRIARESGAKVVPFVCYRKQNDEGYVLQIQKELDNFPSGDDYEDTARINKLIENAVRKHPEQYLWTHRRFKTRPEGEPLIYPKKKKR